MSGNYWPACEAIGCAGLAAWFWTPGMKVDGEPVKFALCKDHVTMSHRITSNTRCAAVGCGRAAWAVAGVRRTGHLTAAHVPMCYRHGKPIFEATGVERMGTGPGE